MAVIGRVFLFLVVNAIIITTLTIIANLLGLQPYLTSYGLDVKSLAVMCAFWGMGGSLLSLLMSRAIAKFSSGVQVIPADTRDPVLRELLQTVHNLAAKAGLKTMPEVGIYDAPDPNAFATGPSKSMALVAVSTGLLSRMNRDEIEGVLGHEITHITNGDMVTMTLLQGIMNAFVMFLSRLIAFAITTDRDRDRGPSMLYYVVQFALQTVFMLFGSMVIAAFSRWREYRADAGSAKLAGRDKMVQALQELQRTYQLLEGQERPALATLQISSKPSAWMKLWSSHPPLEDRIRRLQEGNF